MRRFLLALLLGLSLLPTAQAAAEAPSASASERRAEFQADEGLPGGDLARSAGSMELLVAQENTRSRDGGPRGFGRPLAGQPQLRTTLSLAGNLMPASVPPTPSFAERLPYFATAPPSFG